ncbi:MAG: hypothetical protein GY894_07590 [Planctomycetes bacterium]|nr:hypothetical protein [Planctomycetota bacterium]MCP4839208.1 hypothetical protein [Planctomycetota bacterium]
MRRCLCFTLIAAMPAIAGCSKTYSDKDVNWLSNAEAKAAMADTGGSWLSEAKPNAWVDSRDALYYRVGHIPGSLNVQLSDPDAMGRLDAYGLLIVYGDGYKAPLADAMIKTLLKDGIEEVRGLKGGYEGWVEAGLPIDKGGDVDRRPGITAGDRWQRQPVNNE